MEKVLDDFVSRDTKSFKWRLGRALASSLSGFLAGIIATCIVFLSYFDLTFK